MTNLFDIRFSRQGTRYLGEYRLAHWSGHKAVMDEKGEAIPFAHPMDALVAAKNEFLKQLNSVPAFWRGSTTEDARDAAEAIFQTRKADGQGEDQGTAARQASQIRIA